MSVLFLILCTENAISTFEQVNLIKKNKNTKTMKLKRLFTSTLLLSLTACTIVCLNGCQKGDLYDPEKNKTTLPSEDGYFDFNLTEQLTLDLQYNIPGYKVSFAVFTEDPVEYADGKQTSRWPELQTMRTM